MYNATQLAYTVIDWLINSMSTVLTNYAKKYELSSYKLVSPIQSFKKKTMALGEFLKIFLISMWQMSHILKILTSNRNILKSYTAAQKLYSNP